MVPVNSWIPVATARSYLVPLNSWTPFATQRVFTYVLLAIMLEEARHGCHSGDQLAIHLTMLSNPQTKKHVEWHQHSVFVGVHSMTQSHFSPMSAGITQKEPSCWALVPEFCRAFYRSNYSSAQSMHHRNSWGQGYHYQLLCITQCINKTADGQTSLSVTLLQLPCTFRHHCQLLYIQTSLSVAVHYSMHHRNSCRSDITVSYTFTVTLYIQTSLSVTVHHSMHQRNSWWSDITVSYGTFRHHCQLLYIQTSLSVTVHSDITVSYCTFRQHCQLLCITQCTTETADGETSLSVTVHSDIIVSYCTFRHHCQLLWITVFISQFGLAVRH